MNFSFGGTTTTGSTFGTSTPSTGFSFGSGDAAKPTLFGAPSSDNKPAFNFSSPSGGFSFGAKTTAATTSLFTSPTATTGASAFGANKSLSFGAPPPNQTVGSPGFGQPQQQAGQAQSSLFGQQSTPAPAFGSPATQASTFGSPSSGFAFGKPAGSAATPGFGFSTPASGFGAPQPTVLPASTTAPSSQPNQQSAFGGTPAFGQTAFGAKPAGFSFGGAPPASTAAPSFGTTPATSAGQQPAALGFGTQQGLNLTGTSQAPATSALSFGGAPGPATTATAQSSFSFGPTPASQPNTGLSFGTQPTSQPATGLGFGLQPTSQPATGLSFATQPTSQPASGLGFGTQPTSQPASGLGFGTQPTSQPASGLSFGTQPTSQPATGISFGTQPTSQPATGLGFGQPTSQPGGLNFGAPNTSQPTSNLNLGTATSQPATSLGFGAPTGLTTQGLAFSTPSTGSSQPSSGLSFGATLVTSSATRPLAQFSAPSSFTSQPAPPTPASSITSTGLPAFSSTPASSVATTGLSFGPTPASSASQPTSLGFGVTPASSASQPTAGLGLAQPASTGLAGFNATGLNLGIKTTAATTIASTSAPSGITALGKSTAAATMPSLTTITTTATAAPPQPISSISFAELEENINKWTLELEEQEKTFINQATQINAWDRLLIANGEKIVELNDAVETVKNEQQNLEHELDFVLAQQKELEDLLTPMEKQILENSGDRLRDPEREHMYSLAENLDTQLRQMSEDLKEVIQHLNDTNRGQDSNDPIVQIGRILNTHMSSMQWIDNSIAQISNKLDQLKATHDTLRRDNERSFQMTYN